MLEQRFVASIAERDVDLLLLEELSVSNEFREWLATRIFGEPAYRAHLGVWHSVNDAVLGESDLVYLFASLDGARVALLIENKIDAAPQPSQGERYRKRGEKGVSVGLWDRFRTCVVAPSKYLGSAKHSETYDDEITYEELLAYFQCRRYRSVRFAYKARVLREGIEQNRRGYQPKLSDEMTRFVRDYYEFASRTHGHLGMDDPKPRAPGHTWIYFRPKTLERKTFLVHQVTAGCVKAFFDGQIESLSRIQEAYAGRLPSDATIAPAGKSVSITIDVPKFDPLKGSFEEHLPTVAVAMEKLSLLEGALRRP